MKGYNMENEKFEKAYEVRWDQLDPIGHLRGPVVIDFALNTQMSWVKSYGYGQDKLALAGYDPVVLKIEVRYQHEATIGEILIDIPEVSGLSTDGSMWKTTHEIRKENGDRVASLRLEGTWFNWKSRRAMPPDSELLRILNSAQKSTNFKVMRSIMPGNAE
jgi:acyl-CoA thioesterase FadM